MNNHIGTRKLMQQRLLNLLGYLMSLVQRKVIVHFQMQLNKARWTGLARTDIVRPLNAGPGRNDVYNRLVLLNRKGAVEQSLNSLITHTQGTVPVSYTHLTLPTKA